MIDRLAVLGLVMMFTISLLLPANNESMGYQIIEYHPLVFLLPPWHANSLLLMGAVSLSFHHRRLAGWCGTAAAILAASPLIVGNNIDSFRSGYYVWLSTGLVMGFVGFALQSLFSKNMNTATSKRNYGAE